MDNKVMESLIKARACVRKAQEALDKAAEACSNGHRQRKLMASLHLSYEHLEGMEGIINGNIQQAEEVNRYEAQQ